MLVNSDSVLKRRVAEMLGGGRADSEVLNIIDNKSTKQTDALGPDMDSAPKQTPEIKKGIP